MIFVSSIAAQSGSFSDQELTEDDPPKAENNKTMEDRRLAEQPGSGGRWHFTILRPVVIYGEGGKGNFAMLRKASRLPIPFRSER